MRKVFRSVVKQTLGHGKTQHYDMKEIASLLYVNCWENVTSLHPHHFVRRLFVRFFFLPTSFCPIVYKVFRKQREHLNQIIIEYFNDRIQIKGFGKCTSIKEYDIRLMN